jgi:hypothetical protein
VGAHGFSSGTPQRGHIWRKINGATFISLCTVFACVVQFEFAYDLRDGEGNVFHSVGIVKCREMLEEGRWVLWDLNPGRKPWCWECSSDAERIIRHIKQAQCPKIVAAKNRRAMTVRAQREREQLQESPQEGLESPSRNKDRRAGRTVRPHRERELQEPAQGGLQESALEASKEPRPHDSGDDVCEMEADQDPYFASETAKYLIWLGQIGSEENSHWELYVMKIVSRSKTSLKAFALHGSKPATRKDCIGSDLYF